MQIGELIKDWPCTMKGSIRVEIKRVEDDANLILPGDAFIARKGNKSSGISYIDSALEKGAAAIVVDDENYFNEADLPVPIIWVPNCLSFIAYASAKIYNFPAEALTVIAVTGTNGKTTVTHFIGQILNQLDKRTMVIGTNGVFIDQEKCYPEMEALTTLQAKNIQFLFKEAIRLDVPYVVLEASSIGLEKHRLDHCDIDIGIFLNVTEDHIEDHGSFERYKLSKQILSTLAKKNIINSDDSVCRSIGLATKGKRIFFGKGSHVDYFFQTLVDGPASTTCCIQHKKEKHIVNIPLVGDYQCSNVLAAISCVAQLDFPLSDICNTIGNLVLPEGRFEHVKNQLGLSIVVDYAHTPDAMKMILQTLKKHTKRRLIVMFSCGGNRDKAKRPKMGMIASIYADYIILTTDNARNESPQQINKQIREGFSSSQEYIECLNRKEAIEHALNYAEEGDTIVLLGKGHEKTQQIGDKQKYFSDLVFVREMVKQLEKRRLNNH